MKELKQDDNNTDSENFKNELENFKFIFSRKIPNIKPLSMRLSTMNPGGNVTIIFN